MSARTYVLVHGGGHGGWCYQRLAALLRMQGHEVYTPTLTGLGERAHLLRPDIDLDTHIADVVGVLKYEDLKNVILVGHSYAGMVITGVADRAADRVGHIVYLDAATLRLTNEAATSKIPQTHVVCTATCARRFGALGALNRLLARCGKRQIVVRPRRETSNSSAETAELIETLEAWNIDLGQQAKSCRESVSEPWP